MRTIYHLNKKQNKMRIEVPLGILFVLIFLFFFRGFFVQRLVMPLAINAYRPFSYFEKLILSGFENISLNFRQKKSLSEEVKNLRESIAELQSDILIADTLKKDNETLRALLNFKANEEFIAASILYAPSSQLLDSLVIDLGEDAGIAKGMKVVAFGNILLGKVSSTNGKTSMVELISSPGVQTDSVFEESKIPATVIGQGGGNLVIKLPKAFEIKIGERLLAPAPKPLLIGIVENIKKDDYGALQDIFLRTPLNISELKYVMILK